MIILLVLGWSTMLFAQSWRDKVSPSILKPPGVLGPTQGNPKVTKHPMTEEQCHEKIKKQGVTYENPEHLKICGAPYMAPLYNPLKEQPHQAKSCIDKFEFPNKPCSYPVVWVRASEAAEICQSMGKRMCDTHEWEGACAGSLEPPDYDFTSHKGQAVGVQIKQRRLAHNRAIKKKVWSYGPVRKKGICAMQSQKSKTCQGGSWSQCGSNTYPVGAFPKCRSKLDVYDIHGNVAEHMNLPTSPDEMSSQGSKSLGYTEMKGSWFIFDRYKAHSDHCRWRAPFWHGTKVKNPKSHRNYHLGFRCCKSL